MSEPYYTDATVTLHHGDCLDVLRELPDASVDAVVTDPPYNLSFMAKPWDAYDGQEDAGFAYWLSGLIDGEGHFGIKAHTRGTHAPHFALKLRADERGTLERIRRSLGVGTVSEEKREPNPMVKYVIQDKAGCQRLVDLLDKYPLRAKKQHDYWAWREAVCEWTSRPRGNRWSGRADNTRMADLRDRLMTGRAYADIPWSGHEFQDWCRLWSAECLRVLKPGGHLLAFGGTRTWHRLACAVEDAGFEVRDSIAWLYGSGFPKSLDVSKAIDGLMMTGKSNSAAWRHANENRPGEAWVRQNTNNRTGQWVGDKENTGPSEKRDTPATPDAQCWQGWGTALKPAHEPIVVARKPLASPGVNVLKMVESGLRDKGVEGEIRWTKRPASDAARLDPSTSSSSTGARPTAATSAAPAAASATPNGERPTGNASATSTPRGEQPTANTSAPTPDGRPESSATKSSTPTAGPAPAAMSKSATSSPSTTSTEAAPLTARRPGARSTSKSSARDSRPTTESFAGIATGLTGSWATVRIDRLADGTCVWPDGLPRNTAGGSTVAANVLEHGTGALNINACRVGTDDNLGRPVGTNPCDGWGLHGKGVTTQGNPAGRWPANVVLDESQAEALDEQTGTLTSGKMMPTHTTAGTSGRANAYGADAAGGFTTMETYGDTGGASRFLYVAKADAAERPRVNGTAHPTVKPLALMRWLVRLVTPPGGTVLEPFAGSGTTVEACLLEGFKCIAIEREADYLPLIQQRIHRRRDPVAAVKGAGEDGGLFDLLGEGTA